MITLEEINDYISYFPEERICEGTIRKYVSNGNTKIYLHPTEPRFGASLDGTLYSFRRPRGARGTPNRSAGVDYGRPRVLKGYSDKRGNTIVTITPYLKRKKCEFVNEIFRERFTPADKVGFINGDKTNLDCDNIFWYR